MLTITLTPTTPEQVDAVLSLLVRLRLETMPVEQEQPAAEQPASTVDQPEAEQPKTVRRTRKSAPVEQPEAEPEQVVEPAAAEQPVEEVNTSPEPVQKPAEIEQVAPAYTLEQVRARLAELSQAGKKAEVLAAMQQFGATRLTEIQPEQFGELMTAVEGL